MEKFFSNQIQSTEKPQEENSNFEFSEEIRKELSGAFMKSLRSEKSALEYDAERIRGTIPNSSIEAFKGLTVFSRAVHSLSLDKRIPEKDRTLLKIALMDLSPVGAMEIVPGRSSYLAAVKSVMELLDGILTKEISTAVRAYAEKIFLPPAQAYYNKTIQ